MNGRWKKEEYALLKSTEKVPGRSRRAIQRALTRLNLRARRASRPHWTAVEIALLQQYRQQGLSGKQIAQLGTLPHSANAIQKKLGRMGLSKQRKIFKFTAVQREMLREFLRRNWEGKTPEDLRQLWNAAHPNLQVGHGRIAEYLTRLGLKIHYGEVYRINAARRREKRVVEKLKSIGASPPEIIETLRRMRTKVMRARVVRGRDIWSGFPAPDINSPDEPETVDEHASRT